MCTIKLLGGGGAAANQLDWDAHLRIYIPSENFLSTLKHDRREISVFLFSSYDEMPMYLSPLFSQPPINNAT